jgi:glycoside/pentoside/hexuronide:cation symporter, GPH family
MAAPTLTSEVRLSPREKLAYGFGDLGSCLFWNSFMTNLLMFYTDVFGITAAAASGIFLFSKFWDAANDPLVGILADRTHTRWGRYRPYLLWFSLPLCIAAVLMFTTPDFGPTGKILWAWLTYNLVMTLYTLVNIPYTALLGTISPDVRERSSVSTYKFACAFSAGIIVSQTFMPLTKALADGDPTRGWQRAFMVISAIALPFFLLCFFGTRERVHSIAKQKTPIKQDLADLLRNRPWLILVGLTLAWVFYVAVRATVTNHYLKYFSVAQAATIEVNFPFGSFLWDFETLQRWYQTSDQVASLIGVLIVGLFVKRMDKRLNFLVWFGLSVLFTIWAYFLRPDQVELLMFTNAMRALTAAPLCVLIWAFYADAAEYSEWRNHRQAAGLIFSASTFAQQLGWGFGPAAAAKMLDKFGFVPNVAQTPDVLNGLVLMMSLVPAAFGILSMITIIFYPLKDRRVAEMSEELKLRRSDAVTSVPI